jgi:hypothetical protein
MEWNVFMALKQSQRAWLITTRNVTACCFNPNPTRKRKFLWDCTSLAHALTLRVGINTTSPTEAIVSKAVELAAKLLHLTSPCEVAEAIGIDQPAMAS